MYLGCSSQCRVTEHSIGRKYRKGEDKRRIYKNKDVDTKETQKK